MKENTEQNEDQTATKPEEDQTATKPLVKSASLDEEFLLTLDSTLDDKDESDRFYKQMRSRPQTPTPFPEDEDGVAYFQEMMRVRAMSVSQYGPWNKYGL